MTVSHNTDKAILPNGGINISISLTNYSHPPTPTPPTLNVSPPSLPRRACSYPHP